MIKESLAAEVCGEGKNASTRPQSGSMLLEAVIVLGMIATFTPLLYKHIFNRKDNVMTIRRWITASCEAGPLRRVRPDIP